MKVLPTNGKVVFASDDLRCMDKHIDYLFAIERQFTKESAVLSRAQSARNAVMELRKEVSVLVNGKVKPDLRQRDLLQDREEETV